MSSNSGSSNSDSSNSELIVTYFQKKQPDAFTTDEMFEGAAFCDSCDV